MHVAHVLLDGFALVILFHYTAEQHITRMGANKKTIVDMN